ncbi:MAG TPA: methyltransferase domain-containing protein [Opitutaceae bacterium]|nr:methyltransferase domain-containing protein [Opitutaceae bacterium]
MTRAWLAEASWANRHRAPAALLIGATTFGILALELALIRWTSGQVRAFAYLNNIVLIAAFLGLGLGVALGRRAPGLAHGTLPMLLLVALPIALAEPLGLVSLRFPDQSIALWGAQIVPADLGMFFRHLAVFLALLGGIGAVFVGAGATLGHLFGGAATLRAYTADLTGSLVGVIAFTLAAWAETGPAVWLAIGVAPFVWLLWRWRSAGVAAAIVALGFYSGRGAWFSPYNRIVLTNESPVMMRLDVNRDFHQYLHNLSDARLVDPTLSVADRTVLQGVREVYDLPFTLNPQRGRALVVGAGTGNDVQAALRAGYASVTSVDIDGRIIALGRERHPERPYDNPRVQPVTDDARSFFEQHRDARFDVVCYGLLDSHAMVSAMSTLRLDNYVYTEDGIRAGWRLVAPGGHLSLAMSCAAGDWFFARLFWTIKRATGREPITTFNALHGGMATFIVPGPEARFDMQRLSRLPLLRPNRSEAQTLTLSDDWPFLYLRPGVFPWGYVAVLGCVLVVALIAARAVFGVGAGGAFDWPLFLMGAAFLLIETRGVTSLALLVGSTWIVNSAVFGGILVMVLAANLAVERWRWREPAPWFLALFAATALLWAFPLAWLEGWPLPVRAAAGGLLTGLPIGCAGVIVPMLLARAAEPTRALGANLLGAVLGGCLEYLSIYAGLRATALLALVLYLLAYLAFTRRRGGAAFGAARASA